MDIIELRKHYRDQGAEFTTLKRGVELADLDQKRYIIKTISDHSLKQKIGNRVRGTFYGYLNEISISRALGSCTFSCFRYPKLISTDEKTYFMTEFIDGEHGWDHTKYSSHGLVDALLEYQKLGGLFEPIMVSNALTWWNTNVGIKVLRWSKLLLCKQGGVSMYFKTFLILADGLLTKTHIKTKQLMHNDLFRFNNIITSGTGEFYFFDFERSNIEDKWVLVDIVDLSFDMDLYTINYEMLNDYMKKFQLQSGFSVNYKGCKALIRVILVRKLLGVLRSSLSNDIEKKNAFSFMQQVLFNDTSFGIWFDNSGQECLEL